jgi:hypothetical protein
MSDDIRMDNLVSKMTLIRSMVDRIEDQIDSAGSTDLMTIRSAYVAQLAQDWNEYATSNSPTTLGALQEQIKTLAKFVERFDDVAQQPRRSAIAQSLNTWLRKWTVTNVKWQDYLHDATDELLEEIESQLSTLEQPNFGDEKIEGLVQGWLKYQAKRLRSTEKSTQHVVNWLTHVDGNLFNARRLVEELLAPATTSTSTQVEHPIVAQMRRRWGEQLREQITKNPVEVESLGLDDYLNQNENHWQTLQNGLTNLGTSLASCTEAEVTLVQNQIATLPIVDQTLINDLIKAIAVIRSLQKWHIEKASFLDANLGNETAVTQVVQKLTDIRPPVPTPDEYSSLTEFANGMNAYQQRAECWLDQCEEIYDSMLEKIKTWRDSRLPEEVLQEIMDTEDDSDELTSFDQVVVMSSRLYSVEQQANQFAKESLGPEERRVWQHLQDLKLEGKKVVDLSDVHGDEREPITETIAKLAQKGLIKVKIEL